MANYKEINNYMRRVISSIKRNNFNIWDKKEKYLTTISELGITEEDVLDDICGLTANDNWEVPEPDENPNYPGEVWKCKKCLHGSLIYIKMKFIINNNERLIIMSYHFDNM